MNPLGEMIRGLESIIKQPEGKITELENTNTVLKEENEVLKSKYERLLGGVQDFCYDCPLNGSSKCITCPLHI